MISKLFFKRTILTLCLTLFQTPVFPKTAPTENTTHPSCQCSSCDLSHCFQKAKACERDFEQLASLPMGDTPNEAGLSFYRQKLLPCLLQVEILLEDLNVHYFNSLAAYSRWTQTPLDALIAEDIPTPSQSLFTMEKAKENMESAKQKENLILRLAGNYAYEVSLAIYNKAFYQWRLSQALTLYKRLLEIKAEFEKRCDGTLFLLGENRGF